MGRGISKSNSTSTQCNLLKPFDTTKKLVAIIVTFCNSSTYDGLFTSIQQKVEEGTQVLVYSCSSFAIQTILKAFKGSSGPEEVKNLVERINQVDRDCVVFNWECSSGYSQNSFSEGSRVVFEFLKLILDRGHMAMFSDFSLKALIKEWDKSVLGPNPFLQVGEHSGLFQLRFNPEKLKACPSAQLQIVGEMADGSKCNVNAAGGTIVYGVDQAIADKATKQYSLEILTVATNLNIEEKYRCRVGDDVGAAGHVLLTYKTKGMILTSMGHWIELMKIDTSEKKIFEVAAREYGEEYAKNMEVQYNAFSSESERKEWVSSNAVRLVQEQAPCTNMKKKAR